MLCRTVTNLVKFNAFIQLLMKTFACGAVGWMKCSIVTIGTSATSYLAVTVGTGKAGIEHYLLQAFSILTLEIADKRIVSFAFWETIFLKIRCHILQK